MLRLQMRIKQFWKLLYDYIQYIILLRDCNMEVCSEEPIIQIIEWFYSQIIMTYIGLIANQRSTGSCKQRM